MTLALIWQVLRFALHLLDKIEQLESMVEGQATLKWMDTFLCIFFTINNYVLEQFR